MLNNICSGTQGLGEKVGMATQGLGEKVGMATYSFLRGVESNTAGIEDLGRIVCWLGLFMPAASFARI